MSESETCSAAPAGGQTDVTNELLAIARALAERWNASEMAAAVGYVGITKAEIDRLLNLATASFNSNVCAECFEKHDQRICRQCVSMARGNAAEDAYISHFNATHEVVTGLDDSAVSTPDEWHEKPLLRFTGEYDSGDNSVGIGARSAWVLTGDQSGTVLGDLIAAHEIREVLKRERFERRIRVEERDYVITVSNPSESGKFWVSTIEQLVGHRSSLHPVRRKVFPTARLTPALTQVLVAINADSRGSLASVDALNRLSADTGKEKRNAS